MLRQLKFPALESPMGREIFQVNIVISRTMYRQAYVLLNYEQGLDNILEPAKVLADLHVNRLASALEAIGFRSVIVTNEVAALAVDLYNTEFLPGGGSIEALLFSMIATLDMITSQLIQKESGLSTPFHSVLSMQALDDMKASALKGLADDDRSDVSNQ